MSSDLFTCPRNCLSAIEAQCDTEGDKKRSPFLAEIMEIAATQSHGGANSEPSAKKHRRPLVHELEANLILFNEHLPTERICGISGGQSTQPRPDAWCVLFCLGCEFMSGLWLAWNPKLMAGRNWSSRTANFLKNFFPDTYRSPRRIYFVVIFATLPFSGPDRVFCPRSPIS